MRAFRSVPARSLWFIAAFVAGCLSINGGSARAADGKVTGFNFLQIEPSARAAALGGSLSAIYGDDVNLLFYNPALMTEGAHRTLGVSYLNYVSDLNGGFAAYALEVPRVGVLGAGVRFLSWGDIEGADERGEATGAFSSSDVAFSTVLSRASGDNLRYGIGANIIRSSIDTYSATAVSADAGIAYHQPNQRLTVAASRGEHHHSEQCADKGKGGQEGSNMHERERWDTAGRPRGDL